MKIVRRRTSGLRYACVALALCLFGYGPFSCNEPTVETAREQLRQSNAEGAIEALQGFGEDAPEIHLVRGVAHLNRKETAAEAKASEAAGTTDAGVDPNAEPEKPSRLKEAKSALDQAYRGVAELDAIAAREDEGEDKDLERAQRIKSLRARIAFNQGLVAMADARWSDAQVEFLRVLRLMPDDADARWNLEYAWHQENPPCHKRDDDHEPDDSMTDAKPHQEEQSKDRVLCPGNADWYTVEAERDAILFITIEGEIDTSDAENRTINLALYGPNSSRPMRTAMVKDGRAVVGYSGLRQSGVYRFGLSGPGQAEFKYSVRVEAVPPCPADDQQEPDDSPSTAKPVNEEKPVGLKACPGDPDWHRFTVPKDEERDVQVSFDPERAKLDVALFEADGIQKIEDARLGRAGSQLRVQKADKERTFLLRVVPSAERENTYQIQVAPPQDNENGDNKNQDQKDQKDQKDKQDQKDQKDQQKNQANNKEMDLQKLIETLDQHKKNPQLEKALKGLKVVPRMEDY